MIRPWNAPVTVPCAALALGLSEGVPEIRTARCVLRAPRLEDFAVYMEIACSDRGRYIGGPLTEDEAWADLAQGCATWLLRGHGWWTVVERSTAEVLGFVLIGFEPGDAAHELGFLFRATAEGRGLAFEAAAAAKAHGFGPMGLAALVSYTDPANLRAAALAQRLGGVPSAGPDGTLQFTYAPPPGGQA